QNNISVVGSTPTNRGSREKQLFQRERILACERFLSGGCPHQPGPPLRTNRAANSSSRQQHVAAILALTPCCIYTTGVCAHRQVHLHQTFERPKLDLIRRSNLDQVREALDAHAYLH
ncbi:unnamed protein product, partial [Ectocarpus sp. 12 AP-2014]